MSLKRIPQLDITIYDIHHYITDFMRVEYFSFDDGFSSRQYIVDLKYRNWYIVLNLTGRLVLHGVKQCGRLNSALDKLLAMETVEKMMNFREVNFEEPAISEKILDLLMRVSC